MALGFDPSTLTILASTKNHVVGVCGPAAFYVWRIESTVAAVPALTEAIRQASQNGGRRSILFGAAEPHANFPSADMRSKLAHMFRAQIDLVASAFIFEGNGFRPVTARNIANAISIIARQPFPHKFFSSAADGAAWIINEATERGLALTDAANLVGAFETLRAAPTDS
jgi:hypothetical protein